MTESLALSPKPTSTCRNHPWNAHASDYSTRPHLSTVWVHPGLANTEKTSLNVKAVGPLHIHMVLGEVVRKKDNSNLGVSRSLVKAAAG